MGSVLYVGLLVLAVVVLAARRHKALGLVLMWLTLPVIVILLAPLGHGVRIRYFLFSLPLYLLLVACGLRYASQWLAGWVCQSAHAAELRSLLEATVAVLLLVLVAGISLPSMRANYAETKQNWRDATRLALNLAQP